MNQRKQNGQGQRNVNGSTMMKLRHRLERLEAFLSRRQLAPLLLTLLIPVASAQEGDGPTKSLMHAFVLEFAKMSPYLSNEKSFNTEAGKSTVSQSLKVLSSKVKSPTDKLQKNPGFRITYSLLADHIQHTNEAFKNGEMDYVRIRLNGLGNLCASCHMQAPKISNFSAFEFVVDRSKEANFNNAEFLFVIRRYDEALALLDQLVRTYPKSGLTSEQLDDAFRRKLAIFARVVRNPDFAITNLSTDLKNKELPADARRSIESWMTTLKGWKSEKSDFSKMKTPELLKYVDKSLGTDLVRKMAPDNPQLLNVLRISGILYERLYKEPGEDSQGLLYYLAKCERSLAPVYWYPINEIYLKECVVKYPKQAYSKRCFEAYEEGMKERYFGKPLPEGVQASLKALKEQI